VSYDKDCSKCYWDPDEGELPCPEHEDPPMVLVPAEDGESWRFADPAEPSPLEALKAKLHKLLSAHQRGVLTNFELVGQVAELSGWDFDGEPTVVIGSGARPKRRQRRTGWKNPWTNPRHRWAIAKVGPAMGLQQCERCGLIQSPHKGKRGETISWYSKEGGHIATHVRVPVPCAPLPEHGQSEETNEAQADPRGPAAALSADTEVPDPEGPGEAG
jgi:hypothetical protein